MRNSREHRAERLQEAADKARAVAGRLSSEGLSMAEAIPFGQPILIGHHSEKRDRAYRGRINSKFEASSKAYDRAEDLEYKARAAEANTAIYADATDPLADLDARIAELEKRRTEIKARDHASYELSNLGANIRRLKERRATLAALKATGKTERMAGDVRVVENPEIARIQLFYPGKPDQATRDKLKRNGFRWAPSEGAWQRQLNNAGRYAAREVLK